MNQSTPVAQTDWFGLIISLVWPVVVCGVMLWLVAPRMLGVAHIQAELAARPPVAVIDIAGAAIAGVGQPVAPEDFERSRQQVSVAIQRLREAGYIVFDARQVAAFPPDVEAHP